MRLFFILSILAAVLFQSFSKVILLAGYELNKDKITAVYCENKSKPALHCNGKCHLIKQIKEEEKRESVPFSNIKDKNEIQFFSELLRSDLSSSASSSQVSYFFIAAVYEQPVSSILHPPPITC